MGSWRGLLILIAALSHAARASDWPQFLGPTRDGVYPAADLVVAWPKEGPPVRWRCKTGQGFSGPVVAGSRLVLFHRLADRETVECLETQTGKRIWLFDYPTAYRDRFGFDEGPRSTPAVIADRVYTFGAEGMFHCLELETGKKIWSANTKKQFASDQGFFGLACSPLVEGDRVILNIGGKNGAGIVAFDTASGQVAWKTTDDEASYSSPVAATVAGRRHAFVLTRGRLLLLDPRSGGVSHEFAFRPPMQASVTGATPLVISNSVFISASYGTGAALLRILPGRLETVWAADEILSNHYATSVHSAGFLYGFDGRQEEGCVLRCVELSSGKVRWSQPGLGAGTIILAGNQLLILTEKGELIRADAAPDRFHETGRTQVLPFTVRAYPALANGALYARSSSQLACVDLGDQPRRGP